MDTEVQIPGDYKPPTTEPRKRKPKKPKAPKKPKLIVLSDQVEEFKTVGPDRELCKTCKLGGVPARPSVGIPAEYTKKLLLVFDTPPDEKEILLVTKLVAKAGYKREDVAWTCAVRCKTDDKPSMVQVRCCRPYVLRALDHLKPQLVVAMGSSASRSLTNLGTKTNIAKLRGRPLEVPGRDVQAYATYAPKSVIQGGVQYEPRILEDLDRDQEDTTLYPDDQIPVISQELGFAFDSEFTPTQELLTISVGGERSSAAAESDEPDIEFLKDHIREAPEDTFLVGHSVSGDVDQLVKLGLGREEWVDGSRTLDSLLVSRMSDENRGKGAYDLESLLLSSRQVEPWKAKTEEFSKTDARLWPKDLRRERCRLDSWASFLVAHEYAAKVRNEGQPIELTHRIAMSLHRIELAGVFIDRKRFSEMEAALTAERDEYKDKLTRRAMSYGFKEFNPTNDNDLRTLLFKKMKLEVVKKTKKDKLPSVDKVTLKQYVGKEEVDLLMKFNAADKALSTNIIGVSELIKEIPGSHLGYLPVHINPLGARTGRRSSEKPNMQNWPPKMRQMVVSRYPGGTILEFDFKSLEVFLLAFEAKDDKLFDYFATKGGYIAVAKDMWGTEVKKGTKEYKATKSVVLGTNYNMQTGLMAENLWFMGVRFNEDYDKHTDKVDELRNAYLDMFPGLRPYMKRQERYLLQHQCARTLTGRVRHLPLSNGRQTPQFHRLVNQAINYPIQGLAADVTGTALIDCEAALCKYSGIALLDYHRLVLYGGWTVQQVPLIVNEVHDNLLFDLPWGVEDPRTYEVAKLLMETMEAVKTLRQLVPSFTIPLKVDMKIGDTWGQGED